MTFTFATSAKRDLRGIGLHIAEDNVPRSITFVEEVQERCLTLDQHLQRFPVVGQRGACAVHKMMHAGYVILYVVRGDRVDILRIVHASRDWLALLDD